MDVGGNRQDIQILKYFSDQHQQDTGYDDFSDKKRRFPGSATGE